LLTSFSFFHLLLKVKILKDGIGKLETSVSGGLDPRTWVEGETKIAKSLVGFSKERKIRKKQTKLATLSQN